MKLSNQEAEALLDSLVRAGRTAPTVAQAERIERRLEPWLEPKSRLSLSRSRPRTLLMIVGLGLLSQLEQSSPPAADDRVARVWLPTPRTAFVHQEAQTAPSRAPVAPVVVATAPAARSADRVVVAAPELAAPENEPTTTPSEPIAPAAPAVRESEVDFLRRAQVALATSPSSALEMADAHPSLHPRGVLAQEREVIAIDALVRLGRRVDATARARAFRSTFPRSAHLSRIATLTEQP